KASKNEVWTDDDMVKLIIFPQNDPPSAGNINLTGKEDNEIGFNSSHFVTNFNDVDGDLLNKVRINKLPDAILGTLFKGNEKLAINSEILISNISTLRFIPEKDQCGTAEFSWMAFDGDSWSTTSGKCRMEIAPVADTPLSQSIETIEDTATSVIYISKNPDDGDEVLYFKLSNIQNGNVFGVGKDSPIENNRFISVNEMSNGLIFVPFNNVTANCGFDVEASENGMTVSEQSGKAHITISIIPVDDPPEILSEIPEIQVNEDDLPKVIDLTTVFTDPDSDDSQISIQVISVQNQQLIDANIQNKQLSIQFKENQNGMGQISLLAISNQLTITHIVSIVVSPVDDAPYVNQPINDIDIQEDAEPIDIDLTHVFSDIDTDQSKWSFQLTENSNALLISPVITNGKLTIAPNANQNGMAQMTVLAMADGKSISDIFLVNVSAVDDPPSVLNPIETLTFNEDDQHIQFDLSHTFTDIDNNDNDIDISILANSNPLLLTVHLTDKVLNINLLPDQFGNSELILLAESNSQEVTHRFNIDILPIDDPPEIVQAIETINLREDDPPFVLSVSNVFADKDNDHQSIAISIISNSNESLCHAEIIGYTLSITLITNQYGLSDMVLKAVSNGKSVTHTFSLNVSPVNDAPVLTVTNPELDSITEDDMMQDGCLVSDFTVMTDPDLNAVSGIAIISRDDGNSKWQFLSNHQTVWIDIKTTTRSLLLQSTDRIRFVPNEKQGTTASLTYVAWDQTYGNAGEYDYVIRRGGETAFSENSDTCTIQVSDINDKPFVTNNQTLIVTEGESVSITSGILLVSDVDHSPDQIRFYIDMTGEYGSITIDQTPLNPGETFTQESINNGLVNYHHNGSEKEIITYTLKFSDGISALKLMEFTIQVTPINDPPVIVTNRPMAVGEGASKIMSASFLKTIDADNTADQIIYIIESLPTRGQLFNSDNPIIVGESITQMDIQNELIRYQHDGSEFKEDTFYFSVSDGHALTSSSFTIAIQEHNDAPILQSNTGMILKEGDSHGITSSHLMLADSDNQYSEIMLSILEPPQQGQLNLNDVPSVQQLTFEDITMGRVTYVHNGNESRSDSILFNIYDLSGGTLGEVRFNITVVAVNDLPYLNNNNTLAINEGQRKSLNTGLLFAADHESIFATQIQYQLIGIPEHGQLLSSDSPLTLSETFTQDDIDHERIHYLHDGSESLFDHFVFIIQDADGGRLTETTFNIQIQAINDSPQLSDQYLYIWENPEPNTILPLKPAVDTDLPKQNLTWSIVSGNLLEIFSIDADDGRLIINHPEKVDYETVQNHRFELTIQVQDDGLNPDALSDTAIISIAITDTNEPPVISELPDMATDENIAPPEIIFTIGDPESNASQLSLTVVSSNPKLVPAQNMIIEKDNDDNTYQLSMIPVNQQFGSTEICLTVTDPQNLTGMECFRLTVNEIDDPPVIKNAIPTLSVYEDSVNRQIDLSRIFSDPDNDDASIIKTMAYNDHPEWVNAFVDGNILYIHLQNNQNGVANMAITGTSNGKSITAWFSVTIIPVDDPPEIAHQIPITYAKEDDPEISINISTMFTDIDSDINALTTSLMNNSAPEIMNASIIDNALIIQLLPDQSGTSQLTIRADSDGKSVSGFVDVEILSVDDPPEIADGLSDVSVLEDASTYSIDLLPVFTDKDSDITQMTYSILKNDHPQTVTATVQDNQLLISFLPDQSGQAIVSIMAESDGLTVVEDCSIIISEVDDPPFVKNAMNQIALVEDQAAYSVDLSDWFGDIDSNPAEIVKSIKNNTATDILNATINGNILKLSALPDKSGSANLTIMGVSNGQSVQHILDVEISAMDDPPIVLQEISDVVVNEDASTRNIEIGMAFGDIDNPPHEMSFELTKNTNDQLISAEISGTMIGLSFMKDQFGEADLTVKALSNNQFVTTTIHIQVNAVNDPPIGNNETLSMDEDSTIEYQLTAQDPDNTVLTYQIQTFPKHGVIQLDPSGSFTYAPDSNYFGDDTVWFTASDENLVSEPASVVFNIAAINDPPQVQPSSFEAYERIEKYFVPKDFSDAFIDVDNDSLQTIKIISLPEHGALTLNNTAVQIDDIISSVNISQLKYLSQNYYGEDYFSWKGFDGVSWSENTAEATINVVGSPLIRKIVKIGNEDVDVQFDAADLANFSLDHTSEIKAVSIPILGELLFDPQKTTPDHPFSGTPVEKGRSFKIFEILAGELVYRPSKDFHGFISFMWRASKADIWSDDEEVQINILPINDPPEFSTTHFSGKEDLSARLNSQKFITNCSDAEGDNLEKIRFNESEGIPGHFLMNHMTQILPFELTVASVDALYFIPDPDFSGNLVVPFQGFDGLAWSPDSYSLVIEIQPVGDTPDSITVTTNEDTLTDLIYLQRNPLDGPEVTHFCISNTFGGIITQSDGIQKIADSTCISYTLAQDGIRFLPAPNRNDTAGFDFGASEDGIHLSSLSKYAHVTVNINPVDDPPVLVSSIPRVTVDEDAPEYIIDLSRVFEDPDNDISEMQFEILNVNHNLINTTISNNRLILTFLEDQYGNSVVDLKATSNGQTVNTYFLVTINRVDDPPEVISPIEQINSEEDATIDDIDLSTIFNDIDTDSSLMTFSIKENSNPSLADISIQNKLLQIVLKPNAFGAATISIEALSGGKAVNDTFMLTVTPKDDPPVISHAISDIHLKEDDLDYTVDLTDVFTDPDSNDDQIVLTIVRNDHPDIVKPSISNKILTLKLNENRNGTAEMVVQATSNGKSIRDTFLVIVEPVNDAPTIANIQDIHIKESSSNNEFMVAIMDIDSSISALKLTAYADNQDLLYYRNISFSGYSTVRKMIITPTSDIYGKTTIHLTVSDGSLVSETSVDVYVDPAEPITIKETIDGIQIPDSQALQIKNELTVEARVYPMDSWGTPGYIFSKCSETHRGIQIYLNPNFTITAIIGNELYESRVESALSLPKEKWSHIAVTADSQMMKIYINGEEDRQAYVQGWDLDTGTPAAIGANIQEMHYMARYSHDTDPPFTTERYDRQDKQICIPFQIDAVRLWNRKRSLQELSESMYKRFLYENPVGYWYIKGNQLTDSSDNKNPGFFFKQIPEITYIGDYSMYEDNPAAAIDFGVHNHDGNASDISTRIAIEDQHLIPTLTISGNLNYRMINLFPGTNQNGTTIARLIANNGSIKRYVFFNVEVVAVNDPPIAHSGLDFSVNEETPVTLSAAKSTDIESALLHYSWKQISGPEVDVINSETVSPIFTSPSVSKIGASLGFELKITDEGGLTDTDTIVIYVVDVPKPFTITATAQKGGTISPQGKVSVMETDTKNFTISPDDSFAIQSVWMDGQSKGKINYYTFLDISDHHAITAVFRPIQHNVFINNTENGQIYPQENTIVNEGT
ncbi:MAG: tandem-95 repeat protein, partial [Candidatus Magnetomorum sp.]|nr:tandem-95 repeat protein [Candidatus Magnetomorum sp.]